MNDFEEMERVERALDENNENFNRVYWDLKMIALILAWIGLIVGLVFLVFLVNYES